MHESEQRRRLSLPAARAAPSTSSRPFPQPDPSPRSPSSSASLCRVLSCKAAAPSVVPGRVIGQKRIDQNLGLARLDAKCGMAVPCLFHRNCLLGNVALYWKCKLSFPASLLKRHITISAVSRPAATNRTAILNAVVSRLQTPLCYSECHARDLYEREQNGSYCP